MAYKKSTTVDNEVILENISTEENKPKTKEKRKFSPDEKIPCVSITAGELFYEGNKSKKLYTFADIDDVVEIEFKDLDYAARSKDAMMFKPRFIVQDADFVEMYPALDKVYSTLHTTKDLKDILKMSPKQMNTAIHNLPIGAQEAVKTIAATMVDNGTLDSVSRIRELDTIFGTELLLKLNVRYGI